MHLTYMLYTFRNKLPRNEMPAPFNLPVGTFYFRSSVLFAGISKIHVVSNASYLNIIHNLFTLCAMSGYYYKNMKHIKVEMSLDMEQCELGVILEFMEINNNYLIA